MKRLRYRRLLWRGLLLYFILDKVENTSYDNYIHTASRFEEGGNEQWHEINIQNRPLNVL